MSNDPVVSVIVPLYNEEENVVPLVDGIRNALRSHPFELILVDDGSTDATLARIPADPCIRVLAFNENCGQSAAMFAGIFAARAPVIALLDGDLQNDPEDIPGMMTRMEEGFDLVCGYRAHRRDTAFKRLQSRIANAVRSRFTGDGVRDTGCTLKVMRRECRDALTLFRGMHRFLPALIKAAGWRITECPVNHRPRIHGFSKYGFGNRAFRATADMFGVKWLLSRRCPYQFRRPDPEAPPDGSGGTL